METQIATEAQTCTMQSSSGAAALTLVGMDPEWVQNFFCLGTSPMGRGGTPGPPGGSGEGRPGGGPGGGGPGGGGPGTYLAIQEEPAMAN